MIVYCIRHVPTGLWITPPTGRSRAATSQEPGKIPRLFASDGAAKTSLTWYTRGQFVRDQGVALTFEGPYDFDSGPSLKRDPKAGNKMFKIREEFRNKYDYEIVPMNLEEFEE